MDELQPAEKRAQAKAERLARWLSPDAASVLLRVSQGRFPSADQQAAEETAPTTTKRPTRQQRRAKR